MSLNQSAPVGAAGYGGVLAGQYEPLTVPVRTKTSYSAVTGTLTRGQVITVAKGGADKGKIRVATTNDVGPFGMVYRDKASSDVRVEYISMQEGFIGYLVADGAIVSGEGVVCTTAGKVVAEISSGTVTQGADELVGTFLSKATEVSKSGSGVYRPSDAAQNDVIRVVFAGTRGEF